MLCYGILYLYVYYVMVWYIMVFNFMFVMLYYVVLCYFITQKLIIDLIRLNCQLISYKLSFLTGEMLDFSHRVRGLGYLYHTNLKCIYRIILNEADFS